MPAFPEIADRYCPVFPLASRHDHDTKQHPPRALDSAALVTGATSGTGRTTAVRPAARGHRVAVAGRSSGRAFRHRRGTAQSGGFIPAPPARPQPGPVTALTETAAARLGRVL